MRNLARNGIPRNGTAKALGDQAPPPRYFYDWIGGLILILFAEPGRYRFGGLRSLRVQAAWLGAALSGPPSGRGGIGGLDYRDEEHRIRLVLLLSILIFVRWPRTKELDAPAGGL